MMKYPRLIINQDKIFRDSKLLLDMCQRRNVSLFAVIKGFNALGPICESILAAGYKCLASSRLPHLRSVKERGYPAETLALRIPMLSNAAEVIEYADISLNSDITVLAALDSEAGRKNKRHKVILMRDVGDLREGVFDSQALVDMALTVERRMPNLYLYGIGTSLGCYGSVLPTRDNLSVLADDAEKIEEAIGRKLDIVSGGSSGSLVPLFSGELPAKINNLRIGEALVLFMEEIAPWMHYAGEEHSLLLEAEIIEIAEKPTHPIGVLAKNCFGETVRYQDRGVRKRAVIALGAFDVANHKQVAPLDKNIGVMGCSSDHMILDIHDCSAKYRVGDVITFTLTYQAMLFATASGLIEKCSAPRGQRY